MGGIITFGFCDFNLSSSCLCVSCVFICFSKVKMVLIDQNSDQKSAITVGNLSDRATTSQFT